MDLSLITALLGAQAGNAQLTMATALMRMNADSDRAVVQLLDTAVANANSLANVGDGIGTKLNIAA